MLPLTVVVHLLLAASPEERAGEGVFALSDEAFVAQAADDLAELERNADGLRRLQEHVRTQRGLFHQKASLPYTPEQKRALLGIWASMFDYVMSCEVIRQRYWDFVKISAKAHPVKHTWGFLLTHGALTTQLAHGLLWSDLTAGTQQLEVLLDEPSDELGLPPRAFAHFKLKVIHVATTTQLMTGDAYNKQLRPYYQRLGLYDRPLVRWVLQEMAHNSKVARGRLVKRGVNLFVKNAVDIASDSASRAVFPVQKGVAEWMGDTRVKRKGQPLISRAQVLELLPRMQPGDIILARQNWYLSNIGLPGFWPHAELYLGTREEFSLHFDSDPQVRAWVATQPEGVETLSALLAARHPVAWAAFGGSDEHGDPIRIMEAISEGVSLTGVEHGMRVDYVGVIRPRLSPADRARALVRAFGFHGRPYDFNFDFFSDATLVCTELVYKSYAPSGDDRGVRVGLVEVAGRMTLPANELVRLFDAEHGKEDRQLDFVAFLDGREDLKGAFLNTEEAFRQSYRRLKWDVAQK
jgi:hypothetical protein